MIKTNTLLVGLLATILIGASLNAHGSDRRSDIDRLVDEMLVSMTVEEKVGQMTQVTLGILRDDEVDDGKSIDPEKLSEAIHKYHIGSVLNTISRSLSVDEWHEVISTLQDEALRTENRIPLLYGIDAIHGTNYTVGSTLFPHNIGVGAARSRDLAADIAAATAMEVRASGIRWNFDPVLDVGRNPLWSRFEETYGEDSYLVGELGAAAVRAYEKDNLASDVAVASCIKHFIGYSNPANGKDRTPAFIPDIELWEHYVTPFIEGVEAGASTIMINSGSVNGMPVHGSKRLLTDLLRGELGFEGVIVSDWKDVIRLHTRHRIAESPREAVRLAVEAGIDMSMVPFNFSFAELLTDLVKSGDVSEQRIDESVKRILRLKYELGLFDNAYPEPSAAKNFGDPEYRKLALNAARETMTLLKNEGKTLPLAKDTRVLVAGPAAQSLGALHSSWSYTWQGADEDAYPEDTKTIAAAAIRDLGSDNVVVMADADFAAESNYDAGRLQELATDVDAIILGLGEHAYAESPGVIEDLSLPVEQVRLAEAAIATGKPVILVLVEGRPRVLGNIVDGAAAILQAYRPGSQGANAIVEVLTGAYNPSGVLPYTYPKFTGSLVNYDRRASTEVEQLTPGKITRTAYRPEWTFGHGLSYTEFEFSDLKLDKSVLLEGDEMLVSVTVTNTGDRDGNKAVDLYVSDLYASLAPAAMKLKRFEKVFIRKGESTSVGFKIDAEDLSFVNADLQRVTEAGDFKILVGDLEANFSFQYADNNEK